MQGPSTRHTARTFLVWAARNHRTTLTIPHRSARSSPALGQDQRITWIRLLLTDPVESSTYRLAGLLLLLYAQPLTRIAALRTADVTDTEHGLTLRLGDDHAPVPEPFAELTREHLADRPNLRHIHTDSPACSPAGPRAGTWPPTA